MNFSLPMESALRTEVRNYQASLEIAGQVGRSDSWLVFLPIRHHSPSCAVHIRRWIEEHNPNAVLVEGPATANHLIPFLVNKSVKPPVAIYNFYVDLKNVFGFNGVYTPALDIPHRFHSWHPFAEYSPEYQAIRTGVTLEALVQFIDLGMEERLKELKKINDHHAGSAKAKEAMSQEPWGDQHYLSNQYIQLLLQKTGCRDFNELWFHLFEVDGNELSPNQFFSNLYTFALITRMMAPPNLAEQDGTDVREKYMASQIARVSAEHQKIVVVTGAYHTNALMSFLSTKIRPKKSPKPSNTSLLTPYSYYRLSERAGYASGIPYPWYCQQMFNVTRKVHEGGKVQSAALRSLAEISKRTKNYYYQISTADIIAAQVLAQNLASLRGRLNISPFDVIDAVKTTFLKDDLGSSSSLLTKELDSYLTGDKVGFVPPDLVMFAIERDFFDQMKKLRLPQSDEPKKVKCEVYKQERHREKSRFLWQTVFLDLEYANLLHGPDYVQKESLWLLTEQWEVRWNPNIIPNLVESAGYGGSVSEVCKNKLEELFEESVQGDRRSTGQFLVRATQMGLFTVFSKILLRIQDEMMNFTFDELVQLLRSLVILYGFREGLLPRGHPDLVPVIKDVYRAVVQRIPDFSQISEEALEQLTDDFRTLSQIMNNPLLDFLDSEDVFVFIEQALAHDLPPRFDGVLHGFLYSFGRLSAASLEERLRGYSSGSYHPSTSPVQFLEGLLLLSKSVLFKTRLLKILVEVVSQMTDETFLQLLPGLRRLFTNLIPRESAQLAGEVARQLRTHSPLQTSKTDLPDELLLDIGNIDQEIHETLERWGLIPNADD